MGLAPTGKRVTLRAVQMWRIKDGKVVSKDTVSDSLNFYRELGVIEYTDKGKGFLLFDSA